MSDIVRPIEPFQLNQGFGENPALYAKFGLKGHNGWDFKTKFTEDYNDKFRKILITATPFGKRPIIASCYISHYRTSVDPNGYGNFFEGVTQLYSTWKLTFGHCSSILAWKFKNEGERMAISGSTGNSTGDHLHLTVKRITIVNGVHQNINYNNGYFGAVDPQEFFNELRKWQKEKGKVPTVEVKENPMATMNIEVEVFERLRNNSESYDSVTDYLGLQRNAGKDQVLQSLRDMSAKSKDKEQAVANARVDEQQKASVAAVEKDALVRKSLAEVLGVSAGETLPDLIYMVKRLKDQPEQPIGQNGSVLETLLDAQGYVIDSYTIKKK